MTAPSDQRSAMIRALVRGLHRDGLRAIQADTEGYPRPDLINGVRPDATGQDNLFHLFAVAGSEELAGKDPVQRWPALATYSARTGAKLYVVVPRAAGNRARQPFRALGISPFLVEI